MVKFDEKTLAAERRVYPFIILIGIVLLAIGLLISPTGGAGAVLILGLGFAFFTPGIFWYVDRAFHAED